MYADQVQGPEWRPEPVESSERSTRVLTIEELRKRLGVAAPMETAARAAPPAGETKERPRIVRRREVVPTH